MEGKTLRRSATNQVIAGVCGGVGEYFEVDPTIIRILFIILGLASGSGLILYVILWLVIPSATSSASTPGESTMKEGLKEMEEKVNVAKDAINQEISNDPDTQPQVSENTQKAHNWFAYGLIIIGGLFLLSNWGIFRVIDFGKLWPILFIIGGIYILTNKKH